MAHRIAARDGERAHGDTSVAMMRAPGNFAGEHDGNTSASGPDVDDARACVPADQRERFLDDQLRFGPRGMSTSGPTSKSRPQNSRVPRM